MPKFRYTALDSAGQETGGELEARTSIDAFNQLRRRGLRIKYLENADEIEQPVGAQSFVASSLVSTHVEPSMGTTDELTAQSDALERPSSSKWRPLFGFRTSSEDFAEIAGRIAGITKLQLPLIPGLRALSEELPSRPLRHGLRVLCHRLEQGESLDAVLQSGTTAMPPHVAGLILVGIGSGRLGEIMEWYLSQVRRQIDLRRRCRAALLYPAILFSAALAAALFGLLWIVPEIKTLYGDLQIELPMPTCVLIELSTFVRHYGLYVFVGISTPFICLPLVLNAVGGRALRHRFLAAMPFTGMMFRCSSLAAFCELLSMFVTARLPLPEAVRLAGAGSGDADLGVQFAALAECLEQAHAETDVARRLANISPHMVHVFHWKDRQATFAESLLAAVRVYESQAQMQIALAGMFLEPLVVVGVLGGAVLFMLILLWPLFRLLHSLA